jgi:beta-glucosidase
VTVPTLIFPDGFLWGTATAAHQIEGGNVNNDWWDLEHDPTSGCAASSGDACDSFHRYPEDVALGAGLGLNAYRFSVEWSRIEPAEGEFSRGALDHYRRMAGTCRDHGLVPVVTIHHFTHPRWLAADGCWEAARAPDRFARLAEHVARHLGDVAGMIVTLNEPNVVATMGWRLGLFPPRVQDRTRHEAVNAAMVRAHRQGVEAVRQVRDDLPVGLSLSMTDYQLLPGGETRLERYRQVFEDVFLEATGGDDFLGVQTYTRARVGADGIATPEEGVPTTQMGYEYWPDALEATVRRATEVTGGGVPVIVTENGVGTDDDAARIAYVQRALAGVRRCLDDGIDVRGYFYWSLLDNFEWLLGYGPTFGLVAVDRETFERRPKPSAAWFGRIARSNSLEVDDD